ncbi:pyridoxal 5'-phosphate synthase PDX1-like 4 [Camellia sinensis]|uniref:pyridoxal 5'-phosphate synthase PDX1-like 4 n=1 Tax=Camellia sinensis TaxID=4442 RepID=UPI001035AD99|nr:pyridoxal 5'-phosphate synthase PDX1-like 4 [Camellia sinensis]
MLQLLPLLLNLAGAIQTPLLFISLIPPTPFAIPIYLSLSLSFSFFLSLSVKMAGTGVVAVYGNDAITEAKKSTFSIKVGLAQMLRGGVIMDVVNADQARIAEKVGACAVMALERVPADI